MKDNIKPLPLLLGLSLITLFIDLNRVFKPDFLDHSEVDKDNEEAIYNNSKTNRK